MKIDVKNMPTTVKFSGLTVCLLDKEAFYYQGLPEDARKIALKYQKDLCEKTSRDPLLVALPQVRESAFLFFASPESIKYYPHQEAVKIIASQAFKKAQDLGLTTLSFLVNTDKAAFLVPLLAEGAILGSYRFDRYLSQKDKKDSLEVVFLCRPEDRKILQKLLGDTQHICESVNNARDIINEQGGLMTPEDLAAHAREIARRYGLSCKILDEKALKKERYNGLLTVGAGSLHPPRLIVLSYKPKKPAGKNHLCIVGKGITFDTGGISLKPGPEMWEMKSDMAGGAAAIHCLEAAARLAIPVRITAIVPAAENMIGPRATLPGAIFRARNGKTIHVDNTDAEGRLILTDALALAEQVKPTHLVDLATLTGACTYAIGPSLSGLFGDDPLFNRVFLDLAREAGEPCWELPLYEEYKKYLESDIADINNIGSKRAGGAIHGALFLAEFKPGGVPWIHLDIAGTARTEKDHQFSGMDWKYFRSGATGVGIRTLIKLACHLSKN